MKRILILGSTGYVGSRFLRRIAKKEFNIRCLVRDQGKLESIGLNDLEIIEGDILNYESLSKAFIDVDIVYYFIHSMSTSNDDFEQLDRQGAQNVLQASESNGVKRIVYLGGLGRRDIDQSPHLRSRHEVGDIFRSGSVSVTEFRAAVIVGSGSLSFELIHHLVNRLPIMICPRWVSTRTQPIAIGDVLKYLIDCLDIPETENEVIDIGGPEVITYNNMMRSVANALRLKRVLIQVPVLTPRLSSYWVNLMTPIPVHLARSLIESLRHETICENNKANELFIFKPIKFEEAVKRALIHLSNRDIESSWTDATSRIDSQKIDPSHLIEYEIQKKANVSVEKLFSVITAIGGENGRFYANWIWKLRGFIDKQLGGVGLRRGRRHPVKINVGDALDFWRVEEYSFLKKIKLRAEMKIWGKAWLELSSDSTSTKNSRLTLKASYYPKGFLGLAYWYLLYPFHVVIFKGLAKKICIRAEIKEALESE